MCSDCLIKYENYLPVLQPVTPKLIWVKLHTLPSQSQTGEQRLIDFQMMCGINDSFD